MEINTREMFGGRLTLCQKVSFRRHSRSGSPEPVRFRTFIRGEPETVKYYCARLLLSGVRAEVGGYISGREYMGYAAEVFSSSDPILANRLSGVAEWPSTGASERSYKQLTEILRGFGPPPC